MKGISFKAKRTQNSDMHVYIHIHSPEFFVMFISRPQKKPYRRSRHTHTPLFFLSFPFFCSSIFCLYYSSFTIPRSSLPPIAEGRNQKRPSFFRRLFLSLAPAPPLPSNKSATNAVGSFNVYKDRHMHMHTPFLPLLRGV